VAPAAASLLVVLMLVSGHAAGPADATATPAPTPTPTPPACTNPAPGGHVIKLTAQGLARVVLLHVPRGTRPHQPLPLVVAYAGAGSTGENFQHESGLSAQADRSHFLVAYPTAYGDHPFWNMSGHVPGKPDDVAFTRTLLDTLEASACVDASRVYATGVSNGGGMAARVGCEIADRFTAIAPVAGGYSSLPVCLPSQPVSVLEIHGTGDHVVPYEGKDPDGAGNVLDWLAHWRHQDHCTGRAFRETQPGLIRIGWTTCAEDTSVEHLRLAGIRHGWPGPGVPEAPVKAAAEVWRFFVRHTRTP
jgi:polyhydroxybutyrate depolymerase